MFVIMCSIHRTLLNWEHLNKLLQGLPKVCIRRKSDHNSGLLTNYYYIIMVTSPVISTLLLILRTVQAFSVAIKSWLTSDLNNAAEVEADPFTKPTKEPVYIWNRKN